MISSGCKAVYFNNCTTFYDVEREILECYATMLSRVTRIVGYTECAQYRNVNTNCWPVLGYAGVIYGESYCWYAIQGAVDPYLVVVNCWG